MCKTLEVSRSGYYKYLYTKDNHSDRYYENEVYKELINDIWLKSKKNYGARRITIALNKIGHIVNIKRVRRLNRELGIASINRSKRNVRKRSQKAKIVHDNLVNQHFKTEALNKIWFGDITYIPTKEGTLYLATFVDLYSRKVVGMSMASNMKEQIVLDAFNDAKGRNKYDNGLVVHTDQGIQVRQEVA